MRIIGIVLIIIGIIFGLLGARSYLRDKSYEEASTVVKASVKSVEVKPNPWKAMGSISLVLSYMRDGIADSAKHNFTEAYSNNIPLPTEEELKAASYYVHYVPNEMRNETSYPYRVMVSNNARYEGFYNRALFRQMFTFILMGFMIRMLGRKK